MDTPITATLAKRVKRFSRYCFDRLRSSGSIPSSSAYVATGRFTLRQRPHRSNDAAPVEVLDVVSAPLQDGRPVACSLEAPSPGTQSGGYSLPIRGWVVSRDTLPETVQILLKGQLLRQTSVDQHRPDVAEVYGGNTRGAPTGFTTEVGVLGLPPTFELTVRAVLSDKSHVRIGTIRAHHQAVRSGFQPTIHPLMITCPGRSGSTWLMRLLGEHPEIVVHRSYPYETRVAIYWMHMLKVLSEPADHAASAHPDTFAANRRWVGHQPFYFHNPQWFGGEYVEHLAAFCQQSIEQYYRHVAQQQQQQVVPALFAEKHHPVHTPWMLWELYDRAREVFLVRDFRDMICSVLAFNAKRGYESFGRRPNQTTEEFIKQVGTGSRQLLDVWQERRHMAAIVRYEEVITKPVPTLRRLFNYLRVDASRRLVREVIQRASEDTPALQSHRTSDSAASSLGRWRRDLSPDLQQRCREHLHEALEGFGYPL